MVILRFRRYEDAVREYETVIGTLSQSQKSDDPAKSSRAGAKASFLSRQVYGCHITLGDWKSASKWIMENDELLDDNDSLFPSLEYAE